MPLYSNRKSKGIGDTSVAFVFAIHRFRPVDTVTFLSDGQDKRGLSFGTRQMIFKELLKERVKRNIRLKSDRHEMPVAVQRAVDSNVQPFVSKH